MTARRGARVHCHLQKKGGDFVVTDTTNQIAPEVLRLGVSSDDVGRAKDALSFAESEISKLDLPPKRLRSLRVLVAALVAVRAARRDGNKEKERAWMREFDRKWNELADKHVASSELAKLTRSVTKLLTDQGE